MTDQALEKLTRQIMLDAVRLEYGSLLEGAPEHTFSPAFERKMKKLLRRGRHPVLYRTLRAVACLLLVLLLSGCAVLAISPAAREVFAGWVREIHDNYFLYEFWGNEEREPVSKEEVLYQPSYVPTGYRMEYRSMLSGITAIGYINDQSGNLAFFHCFTDLTSPVMQIERDSGDAYKKITVNGISADLYLDAEEGESMRKLKTIIPVAGILLLILSAASLYVAMQALSDIRPAEDYEDIGALTFQPYDVLPVQVQNTGASSRDRRMNPTKTVYMVYYRATDGSGYKWSDEALTRDLGKDIVEAGETVQRRVLRIPADGTYITVEPEQTAGSYTEGLRGKYTRIVGLSTLYILFYLIVLILVKLVSRLRKNWAANQEVERAAAPRNVSAASQLGPEIEEPRRSRLPESWSGWRQEPGGMEVRKPPRIHPRIKLCLFMLVAVFLLAVFQRLGSSDPVDLDYSWNGNTWICDELGLRFDLPVGGVIYDSEEQQKAREETFGRRGSAGQVLLTVIDPGEGSNLELLVVRTDPPTEDFLLKMATLYAENAAGEGAFELEAREDLTIGGRPWRTWRIELPEQGRVNWYLYRQDGEYALSLTSSAPTAQTPPAILACFQGTNSLGIVPTNQYLPPIGADGYFTITVPPSLLGNMTPEELVEDFQKDAETAAEQGLTPDQLPSFRDLTANGDGSVTYSFTEEQYRRSKETYYAWGLRILPETFGIDPSDIIKRIAYAQIDENGIPWGVEVWIDQTEYIRVGSFSDFIAQFVPMTIIGRYQLMCSVPTDEWAMHVTLRDAETEEVVAEGDFPMEE